MQTVAGQLGVAIENARLFTQEQRRARHLAFLNNISKMAISSEDAEQMMADIVREIQKNFRYDHIGIGIMDYASKEIEIKAEAGTTSQTLGRRIALGSGVLGKVARTGVSALVQNAGPGQLAGVLPESRAVLCLPISYGEQLLGVLNVESRDENAFAPAGCSDPEHAGRSSGDGVAQLLRLPEAAAAIDHRRVDRHQDETLFLGGADFGVEARVPFGPAFWWC